MGHTRGGGIGNVAGSYDHTRKEVEAELRQRIIIGGGYGDITEDELDRLVGKTSFFYRPEGALTTETMIERLEWFANEGYGNEMPDWLAPNVWGKSISEMAKAALDAIRENDHLFDLRWRPIDEAPIPPAEGLPEYWIYRCLIQDDDRNVYAGFARYVNVNARGNSPRVLRWYEGVSQRYAQILKPRYFQPLPQPRKD